MQGGVIRNRPAGVTCPEAGEGGCPHPAHPDRHAPKVQKGSVTAVVMLVPVIMMAMPGKGAFAPPGWREKEVFHGNYSNQCVVTDLYLTVKSPNSLLGIRAGLRLTSMLSLKIADVAVAGEVQNRIRVRRQTIKGKRPGFDMPMHPQAAAALQDHIDTLADTSPNGYLFPGRRLGTRLSKTAGWRAIKRAFRAAGIEGAPTEIGSHTLRKTFSRLDLFSAWARPRANKLRHAAR